MLTMLLPPMRRLLRTMGALLGVSIAMAAFHAGASSAGDGLISGIITQRSGQTFFIHSGARSARPACSVADRWVIDNTTPAGQAMLSTLLTAYSTGRQVRIEGTGNCDVWGDTESVFYIYLPN